MQRLEVSGAVRPIYGSLGVKRLMRWPRRSPDFFFWGFVKDTVFVPPLLANLQDLRNPITAAVALVSRDMLTRVWNEMDYHIDVCHITTGGHIEHL